MKPADQASKPPAACHGGAAGAKAAEGPNSVPVPVTQPASGGIPAGPETAPPTVSGPAPGPLLTPTARLLLPWHAPEDQWHAARRSGIGGSDVAAILGMDPHKGPLHVYEEKHGRGGHADNEAIWWGRELEPVIAKRFALVTGLQVMDPPGTLQHTDYPWALANVDRFVWDDGGIVPLEIKNRSEHQSRQWDDDVPDTPALQAHWYLTVTGYSHAYVAACLGGNRLHWYRIERDDDLCARLIDYLGTWWQRHVIDGIPPKADGSQATAELLARLWDAQPGEEQEVDPVETLLLKERRRQLRMQLAALETELTAVENRMKQAVGKAEIATVGGRPVYSWVPNGPFRGASFRAEEPELAAEYTRLVEAVDTERLAADHPDVYRRYRARVLRVPKEDEQ